MAAPEGLYRMSAKEEFSPTRNWREFGKEYKAGKFSGWAPDRLIPEDDLRDVYRNVGEDMENLTRLGSRKQFIHTGKTYIIHHSYIMAL
jgi:hypothetical protein